MWKAKEKKEVSSSDSSLDSNLSSVLHEEKRKIRKLKKELKKEEKKSERALKKKLKEERRKLKEEKKKLKEKKKKLEKGRKKKSQKNKSKSIDEDEKCEEKAADIPIALMEISKAMAPMTKEEWEKKQSVVRKVLDEETGRYRLIKGDGEVLEEIVSKDRHKEINRQATKGDGAFFQAHTVNKSF